MIRILNIRNADEEVLLDLLLEYTKYCTTSLRGSTLSDHEYKDYKEAIDTIAEELRRRKSKVDPPDAWESSYSDIV